MQNLGAGSVRASRPPHSLQRALSWETLPAPQVQSAQYGHGRLHAQVARKWEGCRVGGERTRSD